MPTVAKLDTRKRGVDSAKRNAAIMARLDVSRQCADNVKSAGKSSPSRCSGKSSGKGGTSCGNTDKCYCCGQVGHRRPDCSRRMATRATRSLCAATKLVSAGYYIEMRPTQPVLRHSGGGCILLQRCGKRDFSLTRERKHREINAITFSVSEE